MIYLNGGKIVFESFPNNETKMIEEDVLSNVKNENTVTFKYENDSDLIKLMLVKDYLDQLNTYSSLIITYMPYSRMDRSENNSAFTLKYIASFINSLNFFGVKVIEPHSDVTPALLENCTVNYINFDLLPSVLKEIDFDKENDYLMFPDAGASKRYQSLNGFQQLVGHKHRDFQTGEIKSLEVIGKVKENLNKVLIVDDLSSFGGTFYFSALKLREIGFKEVYLLVAHCENSIHKGKLLKNDSPIDKVFTTNTIIHEELNDKLKVYEIKDLLW